MVAGGSSDLSLSYLGSNPRKLGSAPQSCDHVCSVEEQGARVNASSIHQAVTPEVVVMLAVIGNVIVGLGVVTMFTATLRLTKRRH
jgi:hypothetical protein